MSTQYPVNEQGRMTDPSVTDDNRTYALLMHLSLLAHTIIPFASIAIAIIMWQSKRSESAFIDDHGKEAVNFQITLLIYSVVLPIITVIFGVLTLGIGLILLIPVALLPFVLGIIGMIMAMVAANRGEYFRYPMTLRFLS